MAQFMQPITMNVEQPLTPIIYELNNFKMYNNFKRIFQSLLLLCVIGSFYNCSEDDGLVIVSGNVIDAITQEPVDQVLFKIEQDRCGLTAFQNCERVNKKEFSDLEGNFRIAFREECNHELQIVVPKALQELYPASEVIMEEISDRYLYTNCHDNLVLYKGENYKLNIIIQPRVLLTMKPISIPSLELEKIEIPQFDIRTNGLINSGVSKILEIESYIGSFDVILTYKDGTTNTKYVKYDYHNNHVINLDIET